MPLEQFNAGKLVRLLHERQQLVKFVPLEVSTNGKLVRLFGSDQNTRSSKFFRFINEVPTILLILIVFLVIFKPI